MSNLDARIEIIAKLESDFHSWTLEGISTLSWVENECLEARMSHNSKEKSGKFSSWTLNQCANGL